MNQELVRTRQAPVNAGDPAIANPDGTGAYSEKSLERVHRRMVYLNSAVGDGGEAAGVMG